MKQKKSSPQYHPNQEDKSGKPAYASSTKINSSTNKIPEDDVNLPDGAETDFKEGLLDTKKKQLKGSLSKKPK
jgi:hypothetical protein